ncbi:hypothetical protein GUITHDRAFT_103955 [Guillardia theta CCMP2712]|uniref:PUB domain-containing protein n=1 Tax=Guillardia theta (strain CCMP2712) TaxID=905079 RepID=L1JNH4_GUITC|nr:hypothetical protein GUITHDRAFT_103955 [Guillardia theta CCMP2712]EKX50141.1 hypothetical protein GUITHDRAFT_103955 [Guillardia theta CCMP2712]|eukprot:XP_005837121.1 hypothetical protein GUITHDRAFT_103955 [Guillardia theta CCMP2712]
MLTSLPRIFKLTVLVCGFCSIDAGRMPLGNAAKVTGLRSPRLTGAPSMTGMRSDMLRAGLPSLRIVGLRGGEGELAVEEAVNNLRSKSLDLGKTNEEVVQALKLMQTYIENIIKNPAETKFQKIRAGNKAFTSKIASLEGAAEVTADTLGHMVTTGPEGDGEQQIEEFWRLSCTLQGHEGDVRGISVVGDGKLVTASRDKSLKLWVESKEEGGEDGKAASYTYKDSKQLTGHEYHVASCSYLGPSDENPNGLILSGSYDYTSSGQVKVPAVVNMWDAETGDLRHSLTGHTATVSSIACSTDGKEIFSASWDKAVWALLPLPGNKLLSGSADRTIRLWDTVEGKCIGTLTGHSDCVRALVMLPDGKVASAGNDCMIKIWSLDLSGNSLEQTCGFCLGTFAGHENFIYDLAVLPNGDLVSAGEDRTIRVWRDGRQVCAIRNPDTVWSIAAISNGDIAAACADGKARIFTQADERMASEEQQNEYEELLAKTKIASHTLGGLQLEKLPGPEALERAGDHDGQVELEGEEEGGRRTWK